MDKDPSCCAIRGCNDTARPSAVLKKMMCFSVGWMPAASSLALRLLYIMRILKGKNIAENKEAA